MPSRITTKLSRVSGDSGFAIFMCAPWIIVRFVSSHIPASRLVKMTDFDWGNHPYYWFTIGKSRINMWVCVCVCAACPRPNLDSAQICVFCWLPSNQIWFAGKHNWDFNHQENINGTSLCWKIPKKVGIICISLPQIRSVQLFYLFRRFTMSQNDDPSQQCRNKHRFLRLFPISGTSKTHFSGWWLIYYNPQYYNIIIYIYMVGGFSPTPLKNMMEWT